MVDFSTLNKFSEMLVSCKSSVRELCSNEILNTYNAMIDLENVIKNQDIYTDKEWNDILDKYRNNYNFLVALVYKVDLPVSVTKNIINGIRRTATQYALRSDDVILVRALFSKKFEQEVFDNITDNLPLKLICTAFNRRVPFDDFVCEPNQKYIDKLGELVFEKTANGESSTLSIVSAHHRFLSQVSRETVYKLAEPILNQQICSPCIASALISNKNLDSDNPEDVALVRELTEHFDLFYFEEIPVIGNDIITSALHESVLLQHIDEKTNKFINKKTTTFEKSTSLLSSAAENCTLPESVEYDLGARLLSMKIRSDDLLTEAIFSHTQNPELLSRIDELLSNNKINAYLNNKNISEDNIRKKGDEYCKKIQKRINKKDENDIPNEWITYLRNFTSRATLHEDSYKTLLSTNKSGILSFIASSPKTPDNVLNDIIDICVKTLSEQPSYRNPMMLAHINKFCNENNVSNEVRLLLNETIIGSIHYSGGKLHLPSLDKKFDKYLLALNLKEEVALHVSNNLLIKAMNIDINSMAKFSNYLKELYILPDFEKEKLYIERVTTCIDKTIEFRDNIKNNSMIYSIGEPYRNVVSKVAALELYPYLYLVLPSLLNEFEKCYNLIDEAVDKLKECSFEDSFEEHLITSEEQSLEI